RSQIIRLIRPVQYFGYRAFFAGETYVSSASAFEQCTIGTLPLAVVEELIEQNNAVARFFIKELATNLGSSDTKIVNLTQKHIRGRLAEALIVLAENYGYEDDKSTLRIYMSREDLAHLSNMTTANAIRTLSAFVNEHLITVDGRRIRILDEPQLHNISRLG
ncbi:MAG: Crp/Fnr family transcriptional regulator, partial [Muribaculaceae bacterium]|nr:Crp/Fnr family transcriptional regulator [Muribaculaceae bacterium]